MKQFKEELKALAHTIRETRPRFKQAQRDGSPWPIQRELEKAQYEFGHLHIVASLLRGRTRDQIEQPKRSFPNERYIKELYEALYSRTQRPEPVAASSPVSACGG